MHFGLQIQTVIGLHLNFVNSLCWPKEVNNFFLKYLSDFYEKTKSRKVTDIINEGFSV